MVYIPITDPYVPYVAGKYYNPKEEISYVNYPPNFYFIYDNKKWVGSHLITDITRRINYYAKEEINTSNVKFPIGQFQNQTVRRIAKLNPEYLLNFLEEYNTPLFFKEHKNLIEAIYYEIIKQEYKINRPLTYKRYLRKMKSIKENSLLQNKRI
jgi:hypothetical protein